ncbi:MAG: ABC transporter ATP-binding protein [Bacillus sp. (in: Bacteria)]|nr:ABC transporter ATP-binding protein [Bacillus sp. (in: firmicutes)]
MNTLLEVRNVSKAYKQVQAVNKVTFSIGSGESVGLVGESGSGKSTIARLILALDQADDGEIVLLGHPLNELKEKQLRNLRKHVQVIFQDPHSSLNPKLPIWKSIIEPLENFPEVTPEFLKDIRHSSRLMMERLIDMVGLSKRVLDCYPHELSGGQKQRVAIARGFSLQPSLLICDEPTASLDVSVQAQILNLLKEMQQTLGVAYLFISHDLPSVHYISNRILVMKQGCLVDQFDVKDMFLVERHPYTRQLVSSAMSLEY